MIPHDVMRDSASSDVLIVVAEELPFIPISIGLLSVEVSDLNVGIVRVNHWRFQKNIKLIMITSGDASSLNTTSVVESDTILRRDIYIATIQHVETEKVSRLCQI